MGQRHHQYRALLICIAPRRPRPSFRLPAGHVRKIYTAIVLPKVEYALPVWYTPVCSNASGTHATGSVRHTREIEIKKVQHLACRLTTGAFRSTATEVLELHVNITPAALRLEDLCYREVLRICSLPKPHPLMGPTHSASRASPRLHCSPLMLCYVASTCSPYP